MRLRPRSAMRAATVGLALASAWASGQAAAATPLTLPPSAPPELLALLGRMEALNIETERFSLSTSVEFAPGARIPKKVRELVALFNVKFAGEARSSPEEGSFSLTFAGATLHVVIVPGHSYVYLGARLARRDGGRPWVDTGRAGLPALFKTSHGRASPPLLKPAPSFKNLVDLLKSPIEATALGASSVGGQQVSGFREAVSRDVFKQAQVGSPGVFGARRASALPETVTVETFIAANGLPVRTRLLAREGPATESVEIDFPAINFPLVVARPPAVQVISLAALRRLEHRKRHSGKHR
jgi:hypothetical protein